MKQRKSKLLTVVIILVFTAGVGLLLYPTVANYWNSFHQTRAIMSYTDSVSALTQEDYDRILNRAKKYNRRLSKTGIRWKMTKAQKKDYESQLAVDESGIMGYVNIPKFHVRAPIYHGTNENVLQIAIGHLEQTSLPVGGKGSQCAVSGHRGLPSAKLFTDLDKVKEGDTWTMTVLNETFTYECDQISVVEPDDLTNLQIEQGKDYCTLVTCTPYGINTHRLLVRGHRIPNADGLAKLTADAIQIEPRYIVPFAAVPIVLVLLVLMFVSLRRAGRFNPAEKVRLYLREMRLE